MVSPSPLLSTLSVLASAAWAETKAEPLFEVVDIMVVLMFFAFVVEEVEYCSVTCMSEKFAFVVVEVEYCSVMGEK